ncbi:MAG TPA: hypothetical protein VKG80_23010 [Trebonia sp.]|nr:hypothetical protein [Trebonia sp.]
MLPVELDHEAEFAVIAVAKSAPPVWLGERDLPLGRGKPVRALNVPVITEFERRMGAARRGGDDFAELGSPAKSAATSHRGPQRSLGGEPPPESGRYPAADAIQVTGGVYEVQDRLLNEGVRDDAGRKAHLRVGLGRDVNDHAAGGPDAPADGDCHMNQRELTIGKTVQFGGCLVAQQRAFSGVQDGGPQPRLAVQRAGKRRIDAPVDLPPPLALELPGNRIHG